MSGASPAPESQPRVDAPPEGRKRPLWRRPGARVVGALLLGFAFGQSGGGETSATTATVAAPVATITETATEQVTETVTERVTEVTTETTTELVTEVTTEVVTEQIAAPAAPPAPPAALPLAPDVADEPVGAAPAGCDPNYSGCVPAYPPDVNCPDVAGPVTVLGSDPHGLDGNGDGVGCEG